MRFWIRSLLILAASAAWFFAGPAALHALGVPPDASTFLWLAALLLGANGLLYAFLRCPRCGKWACLTPQRWSTVWPGFRCRHCGEPY
jgi:hypothetical protein